LNSGPSVPQIDAPQTADLRKHSETASDLPFQLLNGSRWYAMVRDVSRPVRGLAVVGILCNEVCTAEGQRWAYASLVST